MSTDFSSLDVLYPLPAEDLPRQWVLTREDTAIPIEWDKGCLHGWYLGSHPDARIVKLLDKEGSPIGWVIEPLGYLGPTADVLPEDSLSLSISADATAAEFEQALYGRNEEGRSSGDGFAGTWTAVVFGGPHHERFQRVYVGAAHSVVFSPERRTVATTHNLVRGLHRDEVVSRAFDCLSNNAYFTFGLTPFEGLRRLLPNHFLDLKSFQPIRHWPMRPLEPLVAGHLGANAIVEYGRRLIRLLARRHTHFVVFLSAGRDSRAVLSILRPFVAEGVDLQLSTSYGWNFESLIDAQAARRLARISGLPHEVKQRRPHDIRTDAVLRAFARVGEAVAGPVLSAPGVTKEASPQKPFKIGGMGGETGRAFWWSGSGRSHQSGHTVDAELLMKQTRSPLNDTVVEAADEWLRGLPEAIRSSLTSTLDLAYVEQRLGCWQAPMTYLFPGSRQVSSPMLEALPVELMLRLPEQYRAEGHVQRDMVAYGWPELLVVPFNRPTGLLYLRQVMRGVPHLRRRIRRRLARTVGFESRRPS